MPNTVVAPLATLAEVGDTVSWKLQPPLAVRGYMETISTAERASTVNNSNRKPRLPWIIFIKLLASP